jgi:hypothetical protein
MNVYKEFINDNTLMQIMNRSNSFIQEICLPSLMLINMTQTRRNDTDPQIYRN